VFVAAKLDAPGARDILDVFREFYGSRLPVLPVSAQQDVNLSELRKTMFGLLQIIRVYSKKPGRKPDLEAPYILRQGTKVIEAAGVVHKDFAERLRYARLWRRGEIEGLMVGRDHALADGDILELHA
jgi:ribosome-interacting GTPase 1